MFTPSSVGVELSTKQKSTTWPEDDDEEESEDDIEQTLFLHHVSLCSTYY